MTEADPPKPLLSARRALFGSRSRIRAFFSSVAALPAPATFGRFRWISVIVLILFGVQMGTGILLSLYYYPEPGAAYESTRFLLGQVPSGWVMRSLHHWSGELLLGAVLAHLAVVYFRRSYVRPREFQWILGGLLLLVVLAFRFTGRLLPWDDVGHAVSRRGLDLLETVPAVGVLMATWLRGGEDMGPNTLSRFYTTHVLLLPWFFVGLAALHLVLVGRQGLKEDAA